jgi:serine/threonine protein kinase
VQIGPYQLTQWLGHGGMGEVWLGKRTAMGSAAKVVAVKLLRTPDPEARDNFIKEAKLAMLLRHSTIVQVNDVGESKDTCFMEMEWVDGLDLWRLQQRLREANQKLPLGVSAYIIGELLKALAFAHALDVDGKRETIVHRDVTPQNVLISRSGEVKLTDFGIAFMTSDKTSSNYVKGKSRYMSPEHVQQAREPCIDIFGVGAIFHEMLDGRKFRFIAETDRDLWSMAFTGHIPPLSIELPIELEELRRGLLACDLRERFASARAALGVLRRWPGYRDASDELEQLVRESIDNDTAPAATVPLPVVPEGDNATLHEMSETAITDSGLPTTRVHQRANRPATPEPRSRNNHRMLAVTLMLAIFGLAGVGASMVVNEVHEPLEVESPAAPTLPSESPNVVVPMQPPVVERPSAPEPALAEDIEVIPPTNADMADKPDPKPAAKTKTKVTLAASGYPWVRVRIGSATYVLDRKSSPTKTVSLKPGSHAIAFQIDDEDPWQDLGKHRIPARQSARLELRKPGNVVIE